MNERIIHKENSVKGSTEVRLNVLDEEQKVEDKKNIKKKEEFLKKVVYEKKACSYYMAEVIYDNIGPWNSLKTIYEKVRDGKYWIDGKIITIEDLKIVSIEKVVNCEVKRKAWGQRISYIAKEAGTSFEIATIVGNIADDELAIQVLKVIIERLKSEEFKVYMNQFYYSKYNTDDNILKNGIRDFLFFDLLSKSGTRKLNMSNKFCKAVRRILNNK